jgi:WD40 repeat protein
MSDIQSTQSRTLAVLLGASTYKFAPKLAQGRAFHNSSEHFGQYLTETMGVPEQNLTSYFDDRRSASDQLGDIAEFLENRKAELKRAGTPAQNLIVHYVGHGLFSGNESEYCLAIYMTHEQNEGFTSIRIRDLAEVIRKSAAFLRKYLILDCCFSGAAYKEFQSGPLDIVRVKVQEVFENEDPQRGTSLICSASARDPSLAPIGLRHTMFSDSLLTALAQGHKSLPALLSLSDVGELVRIRIQETYPEKGVRPEVHSPDQRLGDVARVPLFPNPAWSKPEDAHAPTIVQQVPSHTEQEAIRQEREKTEAERLERARAEAARLEKTQAETERLKRAEADREKAEAERLELARAAWQREQEKAEAKRLELARAAWQGEQEARALEAQAAHEFEQNRQREEWARDSSIRPQQRVAHQESRIKPKTLKGHSLWVDSLVVTPDGQRVISASRDKTLKVWDLETGSMVRTLEGHSRPVYGVAVFPDGRRVVSASSDRTLKIWDLETGRVLQTLLGHSDGIGHVTLAPDGLRVVSSSWDKTLRVWDLQTGRVLHTLKGHSDAFTAVAVTPDGRRAVSGSLGKTVTVWELKTGRLLQQLKGHSDPVNCVAVTPDGRNVISGSEDKTLRVWDLDTGRLLQTLKGHSAEVKDVAVTSDGLRAVSASQDETLNVWDLRTGRVLQTLNGSFSGEGFSCVAVTPDSRNAISACYDTLKVWDL